MELPYPPTTVQLIDDRTSKATEKRKQAKEALNEAARVTPPDSYQVGDRVWLKAKHLALPYQTPKLAPKCHGPFEIVKKVSPVAYQLKLPTAWTIHDIFHASLLTPYRETMEHRTNYTRPPPDLIEDAKEYEVETIINHQHFGCKRQLQYLIKWKGYPDADNTWESADDVHAPMLIQTYHRKNLLLPPEQDKRGRKKHKVSIRSLKSYLQQHFYTTTTCPPLPPPSSHKASSPPPPSPLLILPPSLPFAHQPPRPLLSPQNSPFAGQPSPSPPILTPRKAKSSPTSITTDIPSLLRVLSMSYKDTWTLRLGHCAPSPLAIPSSISRPKARLSSFARSSLTSVPRCPENPTQNAPKVLKKTMVASPTSPSLTKTASCGKPDTSNWAIVQCHSRSALLVRKATPSSNTTYSPPPHTYATLPPSLSPCGSSTPSQGSRRLIIRPWSWHGALTTGGWSRNSLVITSLIPGYSTSRRRYTPSTASYRSLRWPVVKVAADSKGLTPNIASEPSKLSTLVAPSALMHTPRGSTLAVVGHHS